MNPAYISAVSALAGSSIGAMASIAATWLTQASQNRSQRFLQEHARREKLFGEFIEEAAKRYADAVVGEPKTFVPLFELYAILGKLRLFASDTTLKAADRVMGTIGLAYRCPSLDAPDPNNPNGSRYDFLREFTDACRFELMEIAP
ncbi:hypothetical protein FJ938_07395 [Mesorhizobium sp. B2-4-14]|uniref:hypothetical protein n=1 Tax=Mesorhizobium sp. B2-4-14 TaxID=2589935 RepID=UPI00112B4028|nr:hypothetical protein [Mesorhizobium sp. B2-4-14]TPL09609.1 hypothetical protein FJ938_07395 [Mesorhizobium sp. B2-4-14]